MTTLFISDLHLSQERPDKLGLFYQFMQGPARDADALYILGDLFEAWVGDDDTSPPNAEILAAIKAVSDAAIPVFVMAGNRDFLMGSDFENHSGATLLDDPTVIDIDGEQTLIMHGDTLCTQDVDYLKFRAMVRNPAWQADFLSKPLPERLLMAQHMRAASKEAMKDKIPVIMDVEQSSVEQVMRDHSVTKLIHGHTHRPAVHKFQLNELTATRTVLGDWYQNENVLICQNGSQTLTNIEEVLS